jgi:hypothetical protein
MQFKTSYFPSEGRIEPFEIPMTVSSSYGPANFNHGFADMPEGMGKRSEGQLIQERSASNLLERVDGEWYPFWTIHAIETSKL